MIPQIQGSTQMPPQIQQQEIEIAETSKKKSDMNNSPVNTSSDDQRTAPAAQPRNPAAERKYEEHRIAADLNAQLNSINGDKPKPSETSGAEMENLLISNLKDPAKPPVGETDPPEANTIKALQFMVDGFKSDPSKTPEGAESKFGVWVEDTKL